MPFVSNQGVQIYYESVGSGKPLVLVIGLGGTAEAWRYHVPVYQNAGYQVITLDNRGAGRSDKPDEPYSMPLFASDIKAILDHLGIKKAYFLGLSMGGLIIQEFYHQYPDYVEAMVLGCTGVGAGDPAFVYAEPYIMEVLSMPKTEDNVYERTQKMAEIFYHPDYRSKIPNLVEKLIEMSKAFPQPEYAYRRQLEACIFKDPKYFNSPRLSKIKVPVLVLHGEEDRIWPVANAHYLAKNIPNAKLKIIPKSGHMFFLEKFQEFNTEVLDFFNSLKEEKTNR